VLVTVTQPPGSRPRSFTRLHQIGSRCFLCSVEHGQTVAARSSTHAGLFQLEPRHSRRLQLRPLALLGLHMWLNCISERLGFLPAPVRRNLDVHTFKAISPSALWSTIVRTITHLPACVGLT